MNVKIDQLKKKVDVINEKLFLGRDKLGNDRYWKLSSKVSSIRDRIAQLEYKQMDFDEKVAWWGNETWRAMRMQAEEGIDQLAIFDRKWHQRALKKEPEIDVILKKVMDRFKLPSSLIFKLIEHDIFSKEWQDLRGKKRKKTYV